VSGTVERMPLGALLDDIATPHRGFDVEIKIELAEGAPPKVWRAPEIVHGLGNLIENAADFAHREVRVRARWDQASLSVEVADDGPGFSGEIMERIGEPYVTSRPAWRSRASTNALGKQEGMGLGFFIAKTLIEQTGGTLTAQNLDEGGASVTARWPRGAIDGEKPPSLEFWL
jgi:two-component system sensor histidine kinase RegB